MATAGTLLSPKGRAISYKVSKALVNPEIPLLKDFDEIRCGDLVVIHGFVPEKAKLFNINLQVLNRYERSSTALDQYPCTPLSVQIRPKKQIVIGSYDKAEFNFGIELTGSIVRSQKPFQCYIAVYDRKFKIALNGTHLYTYETPCKFHTLHAVAVEGDVLLYSLQIQGSHWRVIGNKGHKKNFSTVVAAMVNLYPEDHIEPSLSVSPAVSKISKRKIALPKANMFEPGVATLYQLSTPYQKAVQGGFIPGTVLYLSAKPSTGGKRFFISIKDDYSHGVEVNNIAIMFNVNMMTEEILCSHMKDGVWGNNEVSITKKEGFPFQARVHFDFVLFCDLVDFKIAVNNFMLLSFPHAHEHLPELATVEINGDVKIMAFRVDRI